MQAQNAQLLESKGAQTLSGTAQTSKVRRGLAQDRSQPSMHSAELPGRTCNSHPSIPQSSQPQRIPSSPHARPSASIVASAQAPKPQLAMGRSGPALACSDSAPMQQLDMESHAVDAYRTAAKSTCCQAICRDEALSHRLRPCGLLHWQRQGCRPCHRPWGLPRHRPCHP